MVDDDEQLRPSAAEMAQNKPSLPLWHTKETVPKAVERVQIRQSSTPFRRPHWTARDAVSQGLGPVPVPGSAPRGEMVDGASRWPASWALLAISASTTLVLSPPLPLPSRLSQSPSRGMPHMHLEEGGGLLDQASKGEGELIRVRELPTWWHGR